LIKTCSFLTALLLSGAGIAATCFFATAMKAQGNAEKVYKAKCASYHGPDGVGVTPAGKATKARDFCSDEVKKETDEEWTAIIAKGKNKMPRYDKKLTDAEAKDLVSYLRALCKK
jgi:mono/diheme cytochrome c family protein